MFVLQLSSIYLSDNSFSNALPNSWGSLAQVCAAMTSSCFFVAQKHASSMLAIQHAFGGELSLHVVMLQAAIKPCGLLVIVVNQRLRKVSQVVHATPFLSASNSLHVELSDGAAAELARCQQQHHHWQPAILMEHPDSGTYYHQCLGTCNHVHQGKALSCIY